MSLSKLIKNLADGKEITERDLSECLELAQAEVDRIGELIENLPAYDMRVITRIDNKQQVFRFSNVDALADWLVEGWKE